MFRNYSHGTIGFTIFEKYPNLVCRMSTRTLGDMRPGKKTVSNVERLLDPVGLPLTRLVGMRQIHADTIKIVGEYKNKKIFRECDGLVTLQKHTVISVHTADCVPLFFYAPDIHAVAVAHAGWRGTIANIACGVVNRLKFLGSDPHQMIAAIGPHIGGCCYDVDKERYLQFVHAFRRDSGVTRSAGKKYFVDIGRANYLQLLTAGVKLKHIDAPITCTSCQNDRYFSYRKETKETYGEMLGIIGMNL